MPFVASPLVGEAATLRVAGEGDSALCAEQAQRKALEYEWRGAKRRFIPRVTRGIPLTRHPPGAGLSHKGRGDGRSVFDNLTALLFTPYEKSGVTLSTFL